MNWLEANRGQSVCAKQGFMSWEDATVLSRAVGHCAGRYEVGGRELRRRPRKRNSWVSGSENRQEAVNVFTRPNKRTQ